MTDIDSKLQNTNHGPKDSSVLLGRVAAAFQNKSGFQDFSEQDRFQVITRGMFVAVKLLNREWYPDKRSWYVDTDHGIARLIADVTAYYSLSRKGANRSFVEFLRSATDAEFFAFLQELPQKIRSVLIFQHYLDTPNRFSDRLGKIEQQYSPQIRKGLQQLAEENHEAFLEVVKAHDELDSNLATMGWNDRWLTYRTGVPITFQLVFRDLCPNDSHPEANEIQSGINTGERVHEAAKWILDPTNIEDLKNFVMQASDLYKGAKRSRILRSFREPL